MGSIEPPRPRPQPCAKPGDDQPVPEPPTDRALWPTFLRRTIEEERVRRAGQAPPR